MPSSDIAAFAGTTCGPGEYQYDEARRLWNGMIDRRPALIARPTSAMDVVSAIHYARRRGCKIAVKGGGHSIPGYSMCDDGLVIDLKRMRQVRADPERRVVRVQGGALLRHVDEATLAHGLMVPVGAVSHTGIGGLALGGGFGHAMRRFGLTIDSLRAAELVTAQGEILRVSATHHPDLFWALRGGGGNFGIVTEFEFALHPLRDVYIAFTIHTLDSARPALERWRSTMLAPPDELFWASFFRIAPPLQWVPPQYVGQKILLSAIEWIGDPRDGRPHINSLVDSIRPQAHVTMRIPYLDLQCMLDAICPHGIYAYCKAGFIDDLTDTTFDVLTDIGNSSISWRSQLEVFRMGGAIDCVAADATAFPHRGSNYVFNIVSMWDSAQDTAANVEWARGGYRDLEPAMTGGAYVNYMGGEESDGVRAAYGSGQTLKRLSTVKQQVDPENLFCFNQNVAAGDPSQRV
jgi:FAD/FMN-containing dehydrogenase